MFIFGNFYGKKYTFRGERDCIHKDDIHIIKKASLIPRLAYMSFVFLSFVFFDFFNSAYYSLAGFLLLICIVNDRHFILRLIIA